jgi:hypothetical protein
MYQAKLKEVRTSERLKREPAAVAAAIGVAVAPIVGTIRKP